MTKGTSLALLFGTLVVTACGDLNVTDLNNPGLSELEKNPTRITVIDATQGLFIGARQNIAAFNGYVSELGVLGRESYNFDAGDPRFITELLRGPLDGGSPRFGGNLWNERYANIRNANLVLNALAILGGLPVGMSDEEKESIRGVVETIQALDFLLVIDSRDTLGAAIDVNVALGAPLGLFVTDTAVYAHIAALLDDAVTIHLAAGGSRFPFTLPPGFTGFTTPSTFVKFNRALKARVEVYRATRLGCATCWSSAKSAIDASFLDVTSDTSLKAAVDPVATAAMLARGAYYDFGSGSGDLANGIFDPTGSKQRGHPSLRTQVEMQPGGQPDQRFLNKVATVPLKTRPFNHSSDMAFTVFSGSVAPVPIIRNEELILLRAEAELGLGNQPGAAALINYIRVNSGGLLPRAGLDVAPVADVITELLQQRLYSLLFEGGHRWIDARRYHGPQSAAPLPDMGLPSQDAGDNVFSVMPIPADECSARGLPNNCHPLIP